MLILKSSKCSLFSLIGKSKHRNILRFRTTFCSSSIRYYAKNAYSNRRFVSTVGTLPNFLDSENSKINASIFNLMKRYEDIIGLTEVKHAQQLVLQAERDFMRIQETRRDKQDEIRDVQTRLKEIHVELDKTSRGEDRYLSLLTQEHAIIKKEKVLLDEFNVLENSERDCFNLLSVRLRESHQKEREQGERTKYWSIYGSIIGAIVGILGTWISNKMRMQDLRYIVQETHDPSKYQTIIAQLTAMVQSQQQQIHLFIRDLNNFLSSSGQQSLLTVSAPPTVVLATTEAKEMGSSDGATILTALKEQDVKMEREMSEIKQMIAVEHGYNMNGDGSVVYVGPRIEQLLDETEKNLEWKIKVNTLVNVVALYGALALTIPILYALFR